MIKCKISKCNAESKRAGFCIKHYNKDYRNKNKEKLQAKDKAYRDSHKEKIKEYNHQYYQNNREELDFKQKKYDEDHFDERKKYRKQYYLNNTYKIKARTGDYSKNNRNKINKKVKERKENNPSVKARKNLSSAILLALKRNLSSKNGQSITKYIPYSMEEFVLHIEEQFNETGNEWMNWNNWGNYKAELWDDNDQSTWVWNIDHIIPQSQLPYTSMKDENFKICWDLGNLRPYSAKQNILDGNRREMLKIKPKTIEVNLPVVLLFDSENEIAALAAAINTIIFGKIKVKYETLGILGGQYVGLVYLKRNLESQQLHDQFMRLIEEQEIAGYGSPEPDDIKNVKPAIEHKQCYDANCESHLLHIKGVSHCICGDEWNKDHCWSFDDEDEYE